MKSMINIKDVVGGFYRLLFKSPEMELVASLRENECRLCQARRKRKCSHCGCFLPAKQRRVSETNQCPLGKWGDNESLVYMFDGEQPQVFLYSYYRIVRHNAQFLHQVNVIESRLRSIVELPTKNSFSRYKEFGIQSVLYSYPELDSRSKHLIAKDLENKFEAVRTNFIYEQISRKRNKRKKTS